MKTEKKDTYSKFKQKLRNGYEPKPLSLSEKWDYDIKIRNKMKPQGK
ncbi:MAG: hypothetical protein LBN34_08555 [Clostridiales Family XIII bacterium]|jgi:hypothetical protein|nr:hypothetical protein [Clostridiales Family XIII bacterium]